MLRGVAAIATVGFLAGSLVYAYHLMSGIDHKATPAPPPETPVPPPAMSAPPEMEPPRTVEIIPIIPAQPSWQEVIHKLQSSVPPTAKQPTPAPEVEQRSLTLPERVNRAIDRGVAHLLHNYGEPKEYRNYLGLLGLTLLECGLAADHPSVRQIATLIRAQDRQITQTYELTLAILFFDRLGESLDRALIRSLGQRLLSGQFGCGAWSYSCLVNGQRPTASRKPSGIPVIPPLSNWRDFGPARGRPGWPRIAYRGDNSNTQFAMLGLWVAQRHGVPARSALLATEQYFRATQLDDGSWTYTPNARHFRDSMTCAGLMSLAMHYGVAGGQGRDIQPQQPIPVHDAAVTRGLKYLAQALGKITRVGDSITGADARDALYFLWSLERMAVIYDLKKIGEREWYPWAAEMLVETQWADGRWPGGDPVGTCFALLVLKRSNFAKDLQLAVKEPPSHPLPDVSGPTILQGLDAFMGQTGKPPVATPMPGMAKPPSSLPLPGPSIARPPSAK
jgi:hypothetical protein